MSLRRLLPFAVALLAALGGLAGLAASGAEGDGGAPPAGEATFAEVERLVAGQELARAADLLSELRARARAGGDAETATRALVEEARLRLALGGFEAAVELLRAEPWPEEPARRAALGLFYAHTLKAYHDRYSWEIGRRERRTQAGEDLPADLTLWTRSQLFAEAVRGALAAWDMRAALGETRTAALGLAVEPGTYPEAVRGLARDAITYLLVEILADTGFWSPAELSAVYRLDLERLLGDAPLGNLPAAEIGSATAHPLSRLAAALADLEAWHAGAGRAAARLEARRERALRLHAAFTAAEDRRRIAEDLEQRLAELRGDPWWAMGQATLAELARQRDDADALVRARAFAAAGRSAFPESPGGAACAAIVEAIEAPELELTGMASDGPGRRSLAVSARNLPRVHFRAYRVDLERRLAAGGERSLWPQWDEVERLLRRAPQAAWTVDLPPTPDYRLHRTFVAPPLAAPGAYLIVASPGADFRRSDLRRLALPFLVSRLVVTQRVATEAADRVEVQVLDGERGGAVAGAEVTLVRWDYRERTVEGRGTTDAAGVVVLPRGPEPWIARLVVARHGGELALLDEVTLWAPEPEGESESALLFTDRSIYRPGQRVLWKVLAYAGRAQDGALAPQAGAAVRVALHDPNHEEVAAREVRTNDYGTASGEFVVPAGRPLGGWTLRCRGGIAPIHVEEYKRPTFEVTLAPPAEALRLNRPATFGGEARYLFGLPVGSGQVSWKATREPVWPWWWTARADWGWMPPVLGAEVVAAGTAELGADGRFSVSFTPEADERAAAAESELSYRYRLSVAVTDEGGETREAERAFRLGLVAVEARVDEERGFLRAGAPAEILVRRGDLDGEGRAGAGRWRLVELRQPAVPPLPSELPVFEVSTAAGAERYSTPGDRQRPRWQRQVSVEEVLLSFPEGATVASGTLTHDARGEARLSLPALPAGAYRLHYETEDPFGATARARADLVVAGEETRLAVLGALLAERSTARVGETLRLYVGSGFADQALVLETFHGGKLSARRWLAAADRGLLEIPVRPSDRGGFALRLTAVRDHQVAQIDLAIAVPWENRELEVAFSTFRDRLRPGARETWTIKVRTPGGEAAAAEVLAYMYDRALDAYVPHEPPSPRRLFPDRAWPPERGMSLGERGAFELRWERREGARPPELRPAAIRVVDGWGIGGPGRRVYDIATMAPPPAHGGAVDAMQSVTATAESPKLAERAATASRAPASPAAELRSEFSETAFFLPHLLTGADGTVALEFTVPDSVTAWSVWAHALGRELASGSAHFEARTVKDLLARPYLPRFLREGDEAELRVVVNNAGERPLAGEVRLDIFDGDDAGGDPAAAPSLLADFGLAAADAVQPFEVAPGGGATVVFPLRAPRSPGQTAFRVVATAGDLSDGELRPLPILPGRLHLAQSRFVALRGGERRELSFADMARGAAADPSLAHESLVVTLDAQLFYGVLAALPYLVDYPYECTEQTLNRFLSSGIVASLFDRHPEVARMAQELAARDTVYESFGGEDPNRRMALEETPWLVESRGGPDVPDPALQKVLDPRVARALRDQALRKLEEAQLPSGAFPWFPGGPPSPYMTVYLMLGLARAAEFEVEVPRAMVERGWAYLAREFRREWARELEREEPCCVEILTLLNYAASAYPDPSWMGEALTEAERAKILAASFRRWREHSPYLKGLLALTLARAGRADDARTVWASVMDSARTTRDEGTFWLPEERSWLWYNDSIESHAFALRVATELDPRDPRRDGLVQWLFLNKKLNHWKSTRATAEVIYALAHYLKSEGRLASREAATVRVAGEERRFEFLPERYTGRKNQVVIPGERLGPEAATVVVEQETAGLMFASATWHFATDELPEEARGDLFAVERRYFRRLQKGSEAVLEPLIEDAPLAPGDEVEVELTLTSRAQAEYVHLRDPRAAGLEPGIVLSGWRWESGLAYYQETRDSGADFFIEWLPAGEVTLRYRLRANLAGTFRVGPATVESMYAPEFTAYSAGTRVRVAGK